MRFHAPWQRGRSASCIVFVTECPAGIASGRLIRLLQRAVQRVAVRYVSVMESATETWAPIPRTTTTSQQVFQGRASVSGRSIEEEEAAALANQSIKRFVDPADIAALVVFLASRAGRSISGQMIPIDGDSQSAS